MKKIVSLTLFVLIVCTTGLSYGKTKILKEADKNYDFKAVKNIAIMPVTSNNVDLGKVDPERKPKIEAILEKTKKNLRKHMVEGAKNAKTTIPFSYEAPNKKPTTMIIKYNIDKFDNGNVITRKASPFGGKAKVKLTTQFINAKDKSVVFEVESEAKSGSGGLIISGLDAGALWSATCQANYPTSKYLKKLTGFDYDFFSGLAKGAKMGFQDQADMTKEEKAEKDIIKKKTKK